MEFYFSNTAIINPFSFELEVVSTDPVLYPLDPFCWDMFSVDMFEREFDLDEIPLLFIEDSDPNSLVSWRIPWN